MPFEVPVEVITPVIGVMCLRDVYLVFSYQWHVLLQNPTFDALLQRLWKT